MLRALKRFVLGAPLASAEVHEQKITKKIALAVFSSDALSSVAYATEEMLLVLVTAGITAVHLSLPISFAIGALLVVVVTSYTETIQAYPSGGGAYIVAKENLGTYPGLIAAASLMTDYVLTVSVSIASGVAAITSAFPQLFPHRVGICFFCIFLITIANLRGVKESGILFAIPTYFFVITLVTLIGFGFYQYFIGGLHVVSEVSEFPAPSHALTYFLILRGFSSGCAALTGIEAISNGVPIFKKPEAHNANVTMVWMAVILLSLFLAITELARLFHVLPLGHETVVSQIARHVFHGGVFYYLVQAATAMILILAANTSFAGFPMLASLLGSDGYLPRQLSNLGDRLAFSNGILLLGLASAALIFLFNAETHRLIPLYAVGVFISFTLSQAGMVKRWLKLKSPGWLHRVFINGFGAMATFVTLVVIASTKFTHGAWMVILFIPVVVFGFIMIHNHYSEIVDQLHPELADLLPPKLHRVLIPVSTFHKGTVKAVSYALSISDDVRALYIALDPARAEKIKDIWSHWCIDIPLVILETPYRSIIQPLLRYIEQLQAEEEDQLITVVLPEFVAAKWWQQFLHNQTALLIRGVLLFKKGVTVTSVRYFLEY